MEWRAGGNVLFVPSIICMQLLFVITQFFIIRFYIRDDNDRKALHLSTVRSSSKQELIERLVSPINQPNP